jgi:hypothetical protein
MSAEDPKWGDLFGIAPNFSGPPCPDCGHSPGEGCGCRLEAKLRRAIRESVQHGPKRLQALIDELAPRFRTDPQHVVAAVWDLVGEPDGLHYGGLGWVSSINQPDGGLSVVKPDTTAQACAICTKAADAVRDELARARQEHAVEGEGWESINADLSKRLTKEAIRLSRVMAVREKWAVLGMPRDFDEVLFDLDQSLRDPR